MKRSDLDLDTDDCSVEELKNRISYFEEFLDEMESKVKKVIDHLDVSKRGTFSGFNEFSDYVSDIGDSIEWLNDIAGDLY